MTSSMEGQSRGSCGACGKQQYMCRKDARKAAKRMYPGEHMQAYRCRYGGALWHVGHAAPAVVKGRVPRGALYAVKPGYVPIPREPGRIYRRSVTA